MNGITGQVNQSDWTGGTVSPPTEFPNKEQLDGGTNHWQEFLTDGHGHSLRLILLNKKSFWKLKTYMSDDYW